MNFLEERIVKDGVVKPGNVLKNGLPTSLLTKFLPLKLRGLLLPVPPLAILMFRWYLQKNPKALI